MNKYAVSILLMKSNGDGTNEVKLYLDFFDSYTKSCALQLSLEKHESKLNSYYLIDNKVKRIHDENNSK